MKRIELCLSVFALGVVLNPLVCLACDCPLPTVTQERRTAKAIFSGKVTHIAETADSKYIQITFKVEKSWKGAPTRETSLFRENVLTDCDFVFKVGEEYLVYARGDSEKLSTNVCTRTKRLVDAAADIKELGEPEHARAGSFRRVWYRPMMSGRGTIKTNTLVFKIVQ